MKENLKRCFIILGIALAIICRPINVAAQTQEEDNLKVRLQLEEVQQSEDTIRGKIIVENIGIRPVKDVDINNLIPEGVKLKAGYTLDKSIDEIKAGEVITHEFEVLIDKDNSGENGGGTTPDGNGDDSISGDTNNGETSVNTGGINTGDSSNIFSLVSIVLVCGILLIIISKKKKLDKKQIIAVVLFIALGASILQDPLLALANDSKTKTMSLKEKITVNNSDYTFETEVSYDSSIASVEPEGRIISRAEWISEIVKLSGIMELTEVDLEHVEPVFNDIYNHENELEIIYASMYGVLDNEGEYFNPDAPVTREFAAYTAVKLLAFEPVTDIVCDDADEITYLKEVEIAVILNILPLTNNKFYPKRELTEAEKNFMLEGIKAIYDSTKVDKNHDSYIEYKDGVIKLDSETNVAVNGNIVTLELNDTTKNFKTGDIFVLTTEKPYKVVSTTIVNNELVVETEEPTIEETVRYIDAEGYGRYDYKNIITEEGVNVVVDELQQSRISIDEDGSIEIPGKINITLSEEIWEKIGVSGELDFEFKMPKVSYKADVDIGLDGVDVNNVFFKVQQEANLIGRIKAQAYHGNKQEFYKTLLTLPVVGAAGVNILIEVGLKGTLEGEVALEFKVVGEAGLQVFNNRVRAINTLSPSLECRFEGTLKGPVKVSALLEVCLTYKLLDFGLFTGVGIKAKVVPHILDGMVCTDGTMYFFLDIEALKESKIKEWLGISYTWEFFNENNSPRKGTYHIENFDIVDKCTYEKATINGCVVTAIDTGTPVVGAKVKIYDAQWVLVREMLTDDNGEYSINLPSGEYNILVTKNGYLSASTNITLESDETKYLETNLMVESGVEGRVGNAGGSITNALTGSKVEDVTVKIRKGWNASTGEVISVQNTDVNGYYQAEMTVGNYTVELIKDGYLTNFYNIVVIEGDKLNQNSSLVPTDMELPAGELRVVLTWGEQPSDLDSHLVGPTADGSGDFHINYSNKLYSTDGVKYADLDLDDTSSYGPETTTVYKQNSSGIYSFYVHDYSNRWNSSSTSMANSGAMVKVYKGETLCASYPVPSNKQGVYWKVFDYDAGTNKIIPVNDFTSGIQYNNRARSVIENWEVEEKQLDLAS